MWCLHHFWGSQDEGGREGTLQLPERNAGASEGGREQNHRLGSEN